MHRLFIWGWLVAGLVACQSRQTLVTRSQTAETGAVWRFDPCTGISVNGIRLPVDSTLEAWVKQLGPYDDYRATEHSINVLWRAYGLLADFNYSTFPGDLTDEKYKRISEITIALDTTALPNDPAWKPIDSLFHRCTPVQQLWLDEVLLKTTTPVDTFNAEAARKRRAYAFIEADSSARTWQSFSKALDQTNTCPAVPHFLLSTTENGQRVRTLLVLFVAEKKEGFRFNFYREMKAIPTRKERDQARKRMNQALEEQPSVKPDKE